LSSKKVLPCREDTREDSEVLSKQPPPYFANDCDRCTFLGKYQPDVAKRNWKVPGYRYDLYFCDLRIIPTVLARFGEGKSEFLGGLPAALALAKAFPTHPLVIARQIAIDHGLL
jgi:hypothetical protein